jgi:hypothetical protein
MEQLIRDKLYVLHQNVLLFKSFRSRVATETKRANAGALVNFLPNRMVMQKKWCMYRAISPVFRGVSLFDYPNDIVAKLG